MANEEGGVDVDNGNWGNVDDSSLDANTEEMILALATAIGRGLACS